MMRVQGGLNVIKYWRVQRFLIKKNNNVFGHLKTVKSVGVQLNIIVL